MPANVQKKSDKRRIFTHENNKKTIHIEVSHSLILTTATADAAPVNGTHHQSSPAATAQPHPTHHAVQKSHPPNGLTRYIRHPPRSAARLTTRPQKANASPGRME
jgi:hypothetical protein